MPCFYIINLASYAAGIIAMGLQQCHWLVDSLGILHFCSRNKYVTPVSSSNREASPGVTSGR